jgi:hypothetical protein
MPEAYPDDASGRGENVRIEIDDWLTAIVFVVVVLGILFALMYQAARLAVTDLPGLARFSCLPEQDGDATRFTLQNTGTGPAFDVAIRSGRAPRRQPFARTPLLAPGASLTWELSPAAPVPAPPGADASAPDQIVEWLSIEWRRGPAGSGRWTRLPVRIPTGLIAR